MEEKRRGEKNGKEFQEYRYVTSSRLLLALFPSYVSGRPRQASVLSSRKQVLLGGQALLRDWSTESIRRSAPLSLPLSLSPPLSLSSSPSNWNENAFVTSSTCALVSAKLVAGEIAMEAEQHPCSLLRAPCSDRSPKHRTSDFRLVSLLSRLSRLSRLSLLSGFRASATSGSSF